MYDTQFVQDSVHRLISEGDIQGALSTVSPLLSNDQGPAWAFGLLSKICSAAGQLDEALKIALYAYQKEPTSRELIVSLTEVLIALSLEQEAVQYLVHYLSSNPNDCEILRLCIDCQQRLLARQKDMYETEHRKVFMRVQSLLKTLTKDNQIIVDTLEHPFIGGLAIDAGLLPKYSAAGKLDDILFLSGRPANEQLLTMLGRKIPVMRDDSINVMEFLQWDGDRSEYTLNEPVFRQKFWGPIGASVLGDTVKFIHSTNGRTLVSKEEIEALNRRPEVINFTEEEEEKGFTFMRERLSIPADAWHVCVFSRDPTFYGEHAASPNFFRNSTVTNLGKAIDTITQRGGYSVRVGSAVSGPYPHPSPLYRDYASTCRNDFMDIFLVGKCKLYVGTYNGLSHVAFAFNKPLLNINTVNLVGGSATMFIPKLIREDATGELLPFPEVVRRLYLSPHRAEVWEDGGGQQRYFGFIYQENSEDEIADAVQETLQLLDGSLVLNDEDRALQEAYLNMWKSLGITPPVYAMISPCFLRRYRHLLFS
jgi:putative glycosyltransferase (TIGR04372 family)